MTAVFTLSSKVYGQDSKKIDKDTVRIQASNSGIKPWVSFNDGELRKFFNTAVHGQALFFTNNFDIRPGYIKFWQWDSVKKRFDFEIDTSLKYHNGQPISAYDFEFVLIKPFITNLPTTNERIPLSFIKGANELKPGMKFKSGMLSGIKVLSNSKIVIEVPVGHSRFLYALGSLLSPLAPIDEFAEDLYTFKHLPVGSGPYKVSYSDPNSSLVRLEKTGATTGPKFIEVFTDKNGFENTADLAFGGGISGMRKYATDHPNEYQRLKTKLPMSIEVLTFNYQTDAAKDIRFRRSVAMAIDTATKIPGFLDDVPTSQIIPILSYGYQNPAFPYDFEKAKALFATLPKKIREKQHVLVCHGTPGLPPGNYYESIFNHLKAIGMKVKLELAAETNISKGDTETTMVVFGRYIDSNPLTAFSFYLPGTSPEALTPNQEYDDLFRQAENAESIEEKTKIFINLSKNIESNRIVVPMHQIYGTYYVGSRVKESGLNNENSEFDATKIELR